MARGRCQYNVGDAACGLMTSYVPAFVAEEELQALPNPPHVRAQYSPVLKQMLGIRMKEQALLRSRSKLQ